MSDPVTAALIAGGATLASTGLGAGIQAATAKNPPAPKTAMPGGGSAGGTMTSAATPTMNLNRPQLGAATPQSFALQRLRGSYGA